MANPTIKAALAIIPILLATMFFSGVIYDWYWFHEFGIDRKMFPQSIEQYMITGVLAYVMSATQVLPTVFKAAMLISALTAAIGGYLYVFGSDIKKTPLAQRIADKFGDTRFAKFLVVVCVPIIIVAFFFFTLFILAILVLSAGSAGAGAARSKIDSFGSGTDKVRISFRSDAEMSFEEDTYLITCTEERCAFYIGGKAIVVERDFIELISSDVQVN